jgi:hypothetical protein
MCRQNFLLYSFIEDVVEYLFSNVGTEIKQGSHVIPLGTLVGRGKLSIQKSGIGFN